MCTRVLFMRQQRKIIQVVIQNTALDNLNAFMHARVRQLNVMHVITCWNFNLMRLCIDVSCYFYRWFTWCFGRRVPLQVRVAR